MSYFLSLCILLSFQIVITLFILFYNLFLFLLNNRFYTSNRLSNFISTITFNNLIAF